MLWMICSKALFFTIVTGALQLGEVVNCRVGDVEVTGNKCKLLCRKKLEKDRCYGSVCTGAYSMAKFSSVEADKSAPLWIRNRIRSNYFLTMGNRVRVY